MADQSNEWYEENSGSKLMRKVRDAPFLVGGMAGMIAACVHGAYKYKTRGAMSTSVYLMQLRVTAQGIVVGSLAAGMALTMFNEHVLHKKLE